MSSPGSDLRGTFDEIDLRAVLSLVASSGRSGVVHISGSIDAVVSVGDGRFRLVTTDPPRALRRALVERGVIGADQWDRAVGPGGTEDLVGALVGAGADAGAVDAALREHTVDSLFELLLPGGDEFRFVAGSSAPIEIRPGFPIQECLTETEALLARWRDIAAVIPSPRTVVVRTARMPPGAEPVTITPDQWALLGTLDGRRHVSDVMSILGGSALELSEALHELVRRGLAEVVEG